MSKKSSPNVPMDNVTGNPDFALYFGRRTLDDAAQGAYAKGASFEQYAAQLAGSLYAYTVHGNDHGLMHVRVTATSKVLKGRRVADARTLLAFFEEHKAGKLPSSSLEAADKQLSGFHAEILAILVPASSATKAQTKRVNWEQECKNARAERDALAEELTKAKQAIEALYVKLAAARALAVQAPAPMESASA